MVHLVVSSQINKTNSKHQEIQLNCVKIVKNITIFILINVYLLVTRVSKKKSVPHHIGSQRYDQICSQINDYLWGFLINPYQ